MQWPQLRLQPRTATASPIVLFMRFTTSNGWSAPGLSLQPCLPIRKWELWSKNKTNAYNNQYYCTSSFHFRDRANYFHLFFFLFLILRWRAPYRWQSYHLWDAVRFYATVLRHRYSGQRWHSLSAVLLKIQHCAAKAQVRLADPEIDTAKRYRYLVKKPILFLLPGEEKRFLMKMLKQEHCWARDQTDLL